jgi:hypothetical protein
MDSGLAGTPAPRNDPAYDSKFKDTTLVASSPMRMQQTKTLISLRGTLHPCLCNVAKICVYTFPTKRTGCDVRIDPT